MTKGNFEKLMSGINWSVQAIFALMKITQMMTFLEARAKLLPLKY